MSINRASPELLRQYNRATIFFHLQKYKDAIGYYRKSLDIDPRYYKGYCNSGNTFIKESRD